MEIIEVETYSEEVRNALNAMLPQLSPYASPLSEHALRSIISAEATHLFLAIAQGRICGTATVAILNLLTARRARIEDVVVIETMRGRGIARELIAHAIQFSRKEGVRSIELTSHPSRKSAEALYTKMGFRRRDTNTYNYPLGS
jgi:GNAT superfamily N-acetyltransferase